MTAPQSSTGRALTRAEWAVFAVVTAANLVPIWAFRYFPGQDTGDHLYAVEVLRALADGTAPPGLASAFAPALGLKTNVLFHGLMLGLLRLGLSIELAHRLVLSGYALALPLAGLFCLRAAAPASAPLALLMLPLVWSWFAVQGLYNFVLSLPPALVWLGIVARDGGRPRPVAAVALAASAVVVFLAHAVTFSVLLLVTGIRIAFPGDGARAHSTTIPAPVARLVAAGPSALALLPSLLLAVASCRVGVTATAPSEPTVSRWEMYDFPSALGAFFVEFAMRYHLIDLALLGPPLLVLIGVPLLARRGGANPGAGSWPFCTSCRRTSCSARISRRDCGRCWCLRCSVTPASRSRRRPDGGWRRWPWPPAWAARRSWPRTFAAWAARWTTSRRESPSSAGAAASIR